MSGIPKPAARRRVRSLRCGARLGSPSARSDPGPTPRL